MSDSSEEGLDVLMTEPIEDTPMPDVPPEAVHRGMLEVPDSPTPYDPPPKPQDPETTEEVAQAYLVHWLDENAFGIAPRDPDPEDISHNPLKLEWWEQRVPRPQVKGEDVMSDWLRDMPSERSPKRTSQSSGKSLMTSLLNPVPEEARKAKKKTSGSKRKVRTEAEELFGEEEGEEEDAPISPTLKENEPGPLMVKSLKAFEKVKKAKKVEAEILQHTTESFNVTRGKSYAEETREDLRAQGFNVPEPIKEPVVLSESSQKLQAKNRQWLDLLDPTKLVVAQTDSEKLGYALSRCTTFRQFLLLIRDGVMENEAGGTEKVLDTPEDILNTRVQERNKRLHATQRKTLRARINAQKYASEVSPDLVEIYITEWDQSLKRPRQTDDADTDFLADQTLKALTSSEAHIPPFSTVDRQGWTQALLALLDFWYGSTVTL